MKGGSEAEEPKVRNLSSSHPKLVHQLDLVASASGGVAKLRELILTLAVQGKLVPQDPSEVPASELLRSIREEKVQFVAEGRIKREAPPAAITDEERPFLLPRGWEWVRIPEVTHTLGQCIPTTSFSYIDVGSIDNLEGRVRPNVQVIEPADAPSRARKNVKMGTVIYSTIRPYLNNIAVIQREYSPIAIASTAFAVMHPHSGLSSFYLLHYLRSRPFADFVNGKAVGVAYPAISDANFLQGVIALPPESEQTRIVHRIEELMCLCDALEANVKLEASQHAQLLQTLLRPLATSSTVEELSNKWQTVATHFNLLFDRPEAVDTLEQTILQLAVRGMLVTHESTDEAGRTLLKRIRESTDQIYSGAPRKSEKYQEVAKEEELFDLPIGWTWTRIEVIADVLGGIQKTPLRKPIRHHYPYLRVANVQRDLLQLTEIARFELSEDELTKWRLKAGDLLIVEGNGSADEVGRCAVWDGSINPCVFQNHLIRVRCRKPELMAFLKLFLNSPIGAQEMRRLAITSSGLFNLSVGKIRGYKIPLPPLAEQARIVACVESLRHICTVLRERLAACQTKQDHLAQALIDEAAFDSYTPR